MRATMENLTEFFAFEIKYKNIGTHIFLFSHSAIKRNSFYSRMKVTKLFFKTNHSYCLERETRKKKRKHNLSSLWSQGKTNSPL